MIRHYILLSLLAGGLTVTAQAEQAVQPEKKIINQLVVDQMVERRLIETNAQGVLVERYEQADQVLPGEHVRFSIKYENQLEDSAEDIVLVMPVPDQMDFIEGSVTPSGMTYQISRDGGMTYLTPSAMPEDEAERITHIKWLFDMPVLPGETGQVSMSAILR